MTLNDFKSSVQDDRARRMPDDKKSVLPSWEYSGGRESYTIDTFRSENTRIDPRIVSMFMNMKVVDYMNCIVRLSDGMFKPNIERLLKFSDCNADYEFDFFDTHNRVNRDIRVCELLTVAAKILCKVQRYDLEARDGVYIVNCLLVFPFTVLKDRELLAMPKHTKSTELTERRNQL